MKKKITFGEWFGFTLAIAFGLGAWIILIAPLLLAASEYKYSVHILLYIAVCGLISYWLLNKEEDSKDDKQKATK